MEQFCVSVKGGKKVIFLAESSTIRGSLYWTLNFGEAKVFRTAEDAEEVIKKTLYVKRGQLSPLLGSAARITKTRELDGVSVAVSKIEVSTLKSQTIGSMSDTAVKVNE